MSAAPDWDDVFANMAHIPGSDRFPADWAARAANFRAQAGRWQTQHYGPRPRNELDLFYPDTAPRGLFVFVHGGYWMATCKDDWSHLARGAVAQGYAACLPSYTLAPDASLAEIAGEIAQAVEHAADIIPGPLHLAGHSAGGQLCARLMCADGGLPAARLDRLARVTCISGVYDLRPLRQTRMNPTLRLSAAEAERESPLLHAPVRDVPTTVWVGANERPEFLRQARAMAAAWAPYATLSVEPNRHHFDVLDGLEDAKSPLMRAILAP
ncbi:MAG: alpha/beta hydrolase [Pseudomonadota bacterium]